MMFSKIKSRNHPSLVYLIFVIVLLACVVKAEFRGVQEPIPDIEKALGMAAILLSGNLEEEIVKLQNRKMGSLPVTFENVYAELDLGEIILLKPTLKHLPSPVIQNIDLKLDAYYLKVIAEWNNLTVYASYESYYERSLAPPLRIDGRLSFRWESIKVNGSVGISILESKMQTTNSDIDFDFGSMSLDIVDHKSNHVTEKTIIDACKDIAPKLYWDLRWELQSSLETKLNESLASFKLSALFTNPEEVDLYQVSSKLFTSEANQIIDKFMEAFRKTITERKIKKTPLKDIRKAVNAKLGIVSLQGDFHALQGHAGDLSSIHRVGDFSAWKRGPEKHLQLTGFINFTDFSARYNHYEATVGNIKVLGSVKASVISNLAELKVLVYPEPLSSFGYNIVVEKIQVVRLGHISIEVTGMGPLNNFVSLIASMVVNHFKPDIITEINKNLSYIINTVTSQNCLICS